MFQGKTLTLSALQDGIYELNFAAEKGVNVFNRHTVDELKEVLDTLSSSGGVRGLLITSAHKGFVAGADITEFNAVFAQDKEAVRAFMWANNDNFNRIESLPFPVVAAINGFALGGGFELALACDFRVAAAGAALGFPEVGLGIIPGWGGTVRAPRVAGFERGAQWVVSGARNKADLAHKDGLVDAVVAPEELRGQALAMLNQAADGDLEYGARRRQKLSPLTIDDEGIARVRATVEKTLARQPIVHYPAPHAALDAMARSVTMSRDEALEVEFETNYELSDTPQRRALVGMFLAEQQVASEGKKYAAGATQKVTKATVLGAGTMGGGIAFQNAIKGVPVFMKDISQDSLDLGMKEAENLFGKRVKRGAMSAEDAETGLARIKPSLEYEGIEDCDIVIEAVVENVKVKQAVLPEVESKVGDSAVLASNTSSILIDTLAESLARPQNFCGMHFFNPVHAMPLVEVIRGAKTSDSTISNAVAHVLTLGKQPIVVKDCPGFLVNRVLFPYLAGFNLLVRDGADYRQIDRVMEAWGWPMGPAYLLDVVGIDVAVHAASVVAGGFPDRLKLDFQSAMDLMYERERFGQKNGKGFYRYVSGDKGHPRKEEDPETETMLAGISEPVRDFSDDEIVARMMVPMATEMGRCLDEEIVNLPSEADVSLVYGLGFPRFRGGICRWVDEVGMEAFCAMADKYSHLGKLYHPTDGMRAMAEKGQSYFS